VQASLGWRAWFGGVQGEVLVLIAGGDEDLEVQGEAADDRVVVQPGAVRVVQDVVVGPPAAEIVVAP
jgi:hypothetical protein